MTEETPATALRAAGGRIRTRGHTRGTYVDSLTGAVCAVGAIFDLHPGHIGQAESRIFDSPEFMHAALSVLEGYIDCLCTVTAWNDDIARDGEEVAVTMEKAAAHWEGTRDA